jgi:hypothetical protein
MHIDTSNQTQLLLGLAERETHKFIRAASRSASWLIDVGAGDGELSLHFARLPRVSRVYAIEPSTAGLDRNRSLSSLLAQERLKIIPKRAGKLDNVETVTLDSLPLNRSAHGLIKIDVDGGELDVLAGASSLLASCTPDLLIETHSHRLEEGCLEIVRALGYHAQIVDKAWWRRLIPEQRAGHNRWLVATGLR